MISDKTVITYIYVCACVNRQRAPTKETQILKLLFKSKEYIKEKL